MEQQSPAPYSLSIVSSLTPLKHDARGIQFMPRKQLLTFRSDLLLLLQVQTSVFEDQVATRSQSVSFSPTFPGKTTKGMPGNLEVDS